MTLFLTGVFLFFSFGSHFLIMVISMEFAMLAVIVMYIYISSTTSGMCYFMFLIVTTVCMGSYGLTMIMNFYRSTGSDISFN